MSGSEGEATAPGIAGVLVELYEVPDGARDTWGRWYDEAYLRRRARVPGVLAARRVEGVIGSVRDMVLYDLADHLLPYSAAWREVDAADAGEAIPPIDSEQLVYREILTTVEGTYQPEKTDFLHGAFFEVESRDQDEFNDWYNTEHIEFIKTIDGYRNCRRFQCLEVPSKFVALYDVASLADAEAKDAAPDNFTAWAVRVRNKLTTYRERRLFRVVQRA